MGVSDDGKTEAIVTEALYNYLPAFFPDLLEQGVEIDQMWSGIMGFSPDKLPFVGEIRSGEFVSLGFSGHGMPRCFLSSKALALMINGHKPDPSFPTSFLPNDRFGKQQAKTRTFHSHL